MAGERLPTVKELTTSQCGLPAPTSSEHMTERGNNTRAVALNQSAKIICKSESVEEYLCETLSTLWSSESLGTRSK